MPTCLRCRREFTNPVPEVHFPDGHKEIACIQWCSDCNSYAMSVEFRDSSAYRPLKKGILQPISIIPPEEIIGAIIDNAKPKTCACGQEALVWDGQKSVCFDCDEKEKDYERGYAYNPQCTKIIPLVEKYRKENIDGTSDTKSPTGNPNRPNKG